MAITDELREWWVRKFPIMDKELHEDFTAIVKRIDVEHEKACNDAWDNGYEADYLGIENWLIEHQQVMEHHGYIELPKDANGKPIHIGDVLAPPADCDDYVPLQVMSLTYDGYEKEWFFDGEAGGFCGLAGQHMDVAGWTHYRKQPTVDDVLRQFLGECESAQNLGYNEVPQEVFAEYAKRLKLAGEGE